MSSFIFTIGCRFFCRDWFIVRSLHDAHGSSQNVARRTLGSSQNAARRTRGSSQNAAGRTLGSSQNAARAAATLHFTDSSLNRNNEIRDRNQRTLIILLWRKDFGCGSIIHSVLRCFCEISPQLGSFLEWHGNGGGPRSLAGDLWDILGEGEGANGEA